MLWPIISVIFNSVNSKSFISIVNLPCEGFGCIRQLELKLFLSNETFDPLETVKLYSILLPKSGSNDLIKFPKLFLNLTYPFPCAVLAHQDNPSPT